MAGHSDGRIRHRKGRRDAKRGSFYQLIESDCTKLGGDISANPRLRASERLLVQICRKIPLREPEPGARWAGRW